MTIASTHIFLLIWSMIVAILLQEQSDKTTRPRIWMLTGDTKKCYIWLFISAEKLFPQGLFLW